MRTVSALEIPTGSAGFVTGMTLLIVCWMPVALMAVFLYALHKDSLRLGTIIDRFRDSPTPRKITFILRTFGKAIGWFLLVVGFFTTTWDIDAFEGFLKNTVGAATAVWPVAVVATVMTTLVLLVVTPAHDREGMGAGFGTAIVAFALSTGSIFLTMYLGTTVRAGEGSLGSTIYLALGFVPLILLSMAFFTFVMGKSFYIGRVHPWAAGIQDVAFVIALVILSTVLLYTGPIHVPFAKGPYTLALLKSGAGTAGAVIVLVIGVYSIFFPPMSPDAGSDGAERGPDWEP